MKRRDFAKTTLAASLGASMLNLPSCSFPQKGGKKPSLINNIYYRANTFSMVPRHVAQDMQWMADHGSNALTIAISEQDFLHAYRNIELICSEAAKRNLKVFFVTSRWAGVFAGAPKLPSIFAALNPHTWSLDKRGKPHFHSSGPICSIYYPEVFDFFISSIDKAFQTWDLAGIIWDEPKAYLMDYSMEAIESLGENGTVQEHEVNYCRYISRLNDHIHRNYPDKTISFFAYPYLSDSWIEAASEIRHLDYFGADGRPYAKKDGEGITSTKKYILGEEKSAMRYVRVAREKNLKSMVLIENFSMKVSHHHVVEKRLDEIIESVDQFAYYYYPRSCEDPDASMKLIADYVKKYI
ncbi:MAG: hypothetical protein KI790_15195 [Cyclobacteriaceae bacterium]|nr:hypothetical protein [Cyclobacteriaceae bacterium HetDA_MAG_MS6]